MAIGYRNAQRRTFPFDTGRTQVPFTPTVESAFISVVPIRRSQTHN